MRGDDARSHWTKRALFGCALWLLSLSPAHAELFADNDLSTPRRAAASFMQAASRNDWASARAVLDAPDSSPAQQARATELSRQLAYVLSHSPSFNLDGISDDPKGKGEDGADLEQIASLHLQGGRVGLLLRKVGQNPGRWLFSSGTLARVPALYEEHGPSELEALIPPVLKRPFWGMPRWQWVGILSAILIAIVSGRALAYVITRILLPISARTRVLWDDELVKAMRSPLRLLTSVLVFVPIVQALSLPAGPALICLRSASTLFIAGVAWSLFAAVDVVSNLIERRAFQEAGDGPTLRVRGVQTQVRVLRRVVSALLALCAIAVVLMQFEAVRSAGVSLLASAGVAGLVIGLAAQRTLGSLLAGIQLSVTQPIRMGDDVIVEGEFGTIEEITLTYVVVKLWDERRMIVPMNRFLEQPFQNWTKVSPQLHGTVMVYADFSLSVNLLRQKVDELVNNHPLWDKRTKAVHVTDARERTMEIRVLVSAANGGNLFNLRAELREKLVAWLAELEAGRHLPRTRYEGADGAPVDPKTANGSVGTSAPPDSRPPSPKSSE